MTTTTTHQTVVPLEHVRWRLTWIWLIGTAVLFLLLLIQTFTGRLGSLEEAAKCWGWLFSMTLPSLALFISILGATMHEPVGSTIKRPYYHLVLGISLGYLVIILLSWVLLVTVSSEVGAARTNPARSNGGSREIIEMRPADKLPLSMAWLGPLQGLVTAALGYVFYYREPTQSAPESTTSVSPPPSSDPPAKHT